MHYLAPTWHAAFFALAAIPIIIYLIFRRRRKDVPWGAIYILRRMLESKRRFHAWKQYAILALRTLALALLALAFLWPHRPWAQSQLDRFPTPPESVHRIVLLDLSESMSAHWGGATCRDAALSFARKALTGAQAPGQLDILVLDGDSQPHSFDQFPIAIDEVERFLADLTSSHTPADLEQGLQTALQLVRASHHPLKELYLVSDLAARDFTTLPRIERLLASLDELGVRSSVLSFANAKSNNVALFDLSAGMDLLLDGQPTLFNISLGYFGSQPNSEAWLTIVDDQNSVLFEQSVPLRPGRQTIQAPLTLAAGDRTLTMRVGEDDLSLDNTLTRRFKVRDKLNLLVVQSLDLRSGLQNPRQWLEMAMNPQGQEVAIVAIKPDEVTQREPQDNSGKQTGYRTVLDFINAVQLGPALLDQQPPDGVIVLEADELSPEAVEALRLYAIRGGTVLLAPGPNNDPTRFNHHFESIAPALLDKPRFDELDPNRYELPVVEATTDPLMHELESPEHGHIGTARFYNSFAVSSLHPDSHLLLALGDGSPLLIQRQLGRGSTMLWTAGLGMDWHSLVVHAAYPVMFSRVFNRAAAQRNFDINLQPGEPIIVEVQQPKVTLVQPDGVSVMLTSSELAGRRLVRFDQTSTEGAYRISSGEHDESPLTFFVRQSLHESDYRPISDDQLSQLRNTGLLIFENERDLLGALAAHYPGQPLTPLLALAICLFLTVEAGLARRWFS